MDEMGEPRYRIYDCPDVWILAVLSVPELGDSPALDRLSEDEQLIEKLRQYELRHPGIFSLDNGSSPDGLSQPPLQQQEAPSQKANDKGSDKGNNGKH